MVLTRKKRKPLYLVSLYFGAKEGNTVPRFFRRLQPAVKLETHALEKESIKIKWDAKVNEQ